MYKYTASWGKASAFNEIIMILAGSEQRIKDLQSRIEKGV